MASNSDQESFSNSLPSSDQNTSVCLFESSDDDSYFNNKRATFGEIVEDSLNSSNSSSIIAPVKPVKRRVKTITSDSEDDIPGESPVKENTSFTKYRSPQIDSDEEGSDKSINSIGNVSESNSKDSLSSHNPIEESNVSSILISSDGSGTEHDSSNNKTGTAFQHEKKNFNLDSSFKNHRSVKKSDDEDSVQSVESNEDLEEVVQKPTTPVDKSPEPLPKKIDVDTKQGENLKEAINASMKNLNIDSKLEELAGETESNVVYCSITEYKEQATKVAEIRGNLLKCKNIFKTVKLETLPDKGKLLNNRLEVLQKQLTEEDGKLLKMVVKDSVDGAASKPGSISWKELQATSAAVVPRTFGKRALETHTLQKTLTMDRLKNLHDSLATRPEENTLAADPKGLKVELLLHQKRALAWMIWRESQKPSGGILADDMGLGKTLSMISLVMKMKELKQEVESDSDTENEKEERRKSKVEGGTLVVCPATLIGQWEGEISKRCKKYLLSVEVHHGANRDTRATRLAKHDIVITTYKLVMGEHAKRGPLYGVKWRRIILDEAHTIRNHKAQTSLAVCDLTARSRWALTGTPIHNKELDLYALLKFLRCSPFDDFQIWKRWVDNKNAGGQDRLNTVMTSIMLRRTKQQLQVQGSLQELPERKYEVISVQLDPAAKKVYHKILVFSKTLFVQFLHQRNEKNMEAAYNPIGKPLGPMQNNNPQDEYYKLHKKILQLHGTREVKSHEILVLLLRLRQICCHPSLITGMLNDEYSPEDGIEEDGVDIDILDKLNNLNLEEEVHTNTDENETERLNDAASKVLNTSNPVFDKQRENEKIRMTRQIIKEKVIPQGEKVIVVSQWTGMLRIVADQLSKDNIPFSVLDGSVAVSKRAELVENFNNPSHRVKVLLLSLTAGGVGLNLVGANHLLLLDLHWNPQLEAQAQDRIYRVGQTKTVHVYKIVTTDTIEERIKALQENKLSMANDILTGTKASSANKLSLNDLKMLFSINDVQ